jgi:hypothetical protein
VPCDGARFVAALVQQRALVGAILEGRRLGVVPAEIRGRVSQVEDIAALAQLGDEPRARELFSLD